MLSTTDHLNNKIQKGENKRMKDSALTNLKTYMKLINSKTYKMLRRGSLLETEAIHSILISQDPSPQIPSPISHVVSSEADF